MCKIEENGKGFIEVPYDVQTLPNEMDVLLSAYLAFLQQKESQTGRKKKEGKKREKERTDRQTDPFYPSCKQPLSWK